MTKNWTIARDSYDYLRDLAGYAYRPEYPKQIRSHAQTTEFEDLFRKYGPYEIEAWYAVVRWKSPRSAEKTIRHIRESNVSSGELWRFCNDYVQKFTPESFSRFRRKLAKEKVVATAATFPAFIWPEKFPMVDTVITEWSRLNGVSHRLASPPDLNGGVLYERHWYFVEDWIKWCQRMATILTRRTDEHWRARDVEMAVFTAQRSKGKISLNPLDDLK